MKAIFTNLKKRIALFLVLVILFSVGWFANSVHSNYSIISQEPFAVAKERVSPGDHVKESQIRVYKDRIIIDVNNAIYARYADTNSMDPLFDKGANGLEIKPKSQEEISIGDIIAYEATWTEGVVIHRVVAIGDDEKGIYYLAKGDNNPSQDPQRIRFNEVEFILIGIIY